MLKKRSRAMQKEHCFSSNAAAAAAEKMRSSPFFSVPGLFVGFTAKGKGLPDSADAVRSPTSPLDHKLFSLQSPKSPERCWDCSRVGLGLLNSLGDEKNLSRSVGKNILLAPQMRTINAPGPKSSPLSSNGGGEHARSLPKDYGVSTPLMPRSLFSQLGSFKKIDSCCPTDHKSQPKSDVFPFNISKNPELDSGPLLSGSLPISIDSIHGYMGSLISASEIELSEDYTCIISHGPNPKTTHIFGDCILQKYVLESLDSSKNKQGEKGGVPHWIEQRSENSPPLLLSNDFLSFCCSCNDKLEAGRDIYMYRGEKAFCSCSCRDRAILLEEEMEKKPAAATGSCDSASSSSFHEEEDHFLERNGGNWFM